MVSRPLRAASLATLLAATLATSAHADGTAPTAAAKETARGLMTQGRERRAHDDLRGALESFKSADAIMHVPTTGFELARAQVALGQLVEARETLGQLLRRPGRADDPKAFVEARTNAESLDDDLVKRIPTLRIELRDAPAQGTTVSVDDGALPPEASSAPLKLDPGHHVIVAGAHGMTARAEVDLAERDTKSVTLTVPPPPPSTDMTVSDPAPVDTSSEGHGARTAMIAGFTVAGVGLAVGAVTGLMSMSKTSTVKQSCVDDVCAASSANDLNAARTMATVSTVSFAVGGAGLLVGVGALIFGHDASPASDPAAARGVTPWIGLGSAGLRGSF